MTNERVTKMYKIMIKRSTAKDFYEWFSVDGQVYETDSLVALADMYKGLMKTFPTDSIVPIQVLDTEILVTITDNSNA